MTHCIEITVSQKICLLVMKWQIIMLLHSHVASLTVLNLKTLLIQCSTINQVDNFPSPLIMLLKYCLTYCNNLTVSA